jgi:hypothetical protein
MGCFLRVVGWWLSAASCRSLNYAAGAFVGKGGVRGRPEIIVRNRLMIWLKPYY